MLYILWKAEEVMNKYSKATPIKKYEIMPFQIIRRNRFWKIRQSILSKVNLLIFRHKTTGFVCALKSVSKKLIK